MGMSCIEKGQLVVIDGETNELKSEIDKNLWQLENKHTGLLSVRKLDEIHQLYIDSRLIFSLDENLLVNNKIKLSKKEILDELPKKKRDQVVIRNLYVCEIRRQNIHCFRGLSFESLIQGVWKKKLKCKGKCPHNSTVYRWWLIYSRSGYDIRSLIPKTEKRGNYSGRYPSEVISIVKSSISAKFMSRERYTIQDTYYDCVLRVKNENKLRPKDLHLPMPSYRLVRRVIGKIPKYDKHVARYGRQAARVKFRSVLGHVSTDTVLERVEIDHSRLNIFVIDDETMLPLGRPWLTVCIDYHSRSVLGIYIGFEPPSHLSVARCLREALLPKTDLKEKYPNIKNDWISYGVMQTLVVDNGREFHTESLDALCFSFGTTIQYTPRKTPWFKGVIERFIGSFNRGVTQGVPGTTFENFMEKDDYDAVKKATVTLSSIQEIARIWIVDFYHQKPHDALDQSPNSAWRESAAKIQIPLVENVDDLDHLLGKITTRMVSHKGVEINRLFYNSEGLTEMRMKLGDILRNVTIRYDDGDLGNIYVTNPKTSEVIRVPAIEYDYAKGLTAWQHKVCKRFARHNMNNLKNIEALAEAKETIRELIERDFFKKKTKSRLKMKRFLTTETEPKKKEKHTNKAEEKDKDNSSVKLPAFDLSYFPKLLDSSIEDRL